MNKSSDNRYAQISWLTDIERILGLQDQNNIKLL